MTYHNPIANIPTYLTYDDVLLLPNYSEITPSHTKIDTQLTAKIPLKLPIVASPMDTVCEERMAEAIAKLGGYGIIHRNLKIADQAAQLKNVLDKGLLAGAAVGVGSDFQERIEALAAVGAREICIDSAHGHTKHVIEAVTTIKKKYPRIEVIAGNVATYDGAAALFQAGASAVKVGMGPGSICTTRLVSGMGVPQLTAVVEGVRAAKKFHGYIIADGGIKAGGDIVKALAAGASSVMLGSLLATVDESPGEVMKIEGKLYKNYRGMGSRAAMKKGSAERYGQDPHTVNDKKLVPEGIEALVEYQGTLEYQLDQLVGGLRAGMAYLGAANLKELQEKAHFIQITAAGWSESKPHSVTTHS